MSSDRNRLLQCGLIAVNCVSVIVNPQVRLDNWMADWSASVIQTCALLNHIAHKNQPFSWWDRHCMH